MRSRARKAWHKEGMMAAQWGNIIYWTTVAFAVFCVIATVVTYIMWISSGLPAAPGVPREGGATGQWFDWIGGLEMLLMGTGAYIAGRGFRLSLTGR